MTTRLTELAISTTGNITGNILVGNTVRTDNYQYANGAPFTGSSGTYGNTQVGNFLAAGQVGNIIPLGNAVYSLGNATNQWSNLWVANNTIYLGGVPVGITAGNVLTVDGQAVLSNDSDTNISTTGNVTAGNVSGDVAFFNDVNVNNAGANKLLYTDANRNIYDTGFSYDSGNDVISGSGNISAGYFIGDGSLLTNLPSGGNATLPLSNGTSNFNIATANGNATVTTDGTWTWTFGTDGNLTIPNNIVSNTTIEIDNRMSGNTADIILSSADDITLQGRDRSSGSGTEGGDINIYAGDSAEDGDSSGGDIQIFAGAGGAANVDFGGAGGFITIRAGQGGSAIGDGVSVAESGGSLTLEAGDAGGNNGNINRGADGGDVYINAGESTGNLAAGGDIVLTTGPGGSNAPAGNVRIIIPSSDRGTGGTWIFGHNGNLTLPNTGNIDGADGTVARFQALDEGVVRASMALNPNYGLTRLDSWDSEDNQNFTASDWSSATYTTGGIGGEIAFVDAPNIINFINSIETSRVFLQVNSGTPVPYDGYSSGGNNITFSTTVAPATSPTTVTDFVIYYSTRSRMEMDYDEGELNITARGLDLTINGDQDVDVQSSDRLRIENSSNVNGITISTDVANTFRTWTFDVAGNLNLPLGGSISEGPSPSLLGNAVTITPANGSDPNQQLKIYPTFAEGNHLHLTSGNLAVTDVFLGDDSQYIRTTTTGGMIVGTGGGEISGGYVWSFEENGNLIFPDGASIGSGAFNGTASSTVSLNAFSPDGNTVSFQAQGNTSSAVISVFSNAGPVTSNWTFTTAPLDPSESFLYVPNGGAISTPDATGGEGGKNIFIQAGASDPVTWNSNPGGELMLKGGYGSFGDGGGGPGGDVNIEGGASSDSHAGNVNISSGLNTWVFDYTGNLTIPGSSGGLIKTVANASIGIVAMDDGSDNPAQLMSWNVSQPNPNTIISAYANYAAVTTDVNGTVKSWLFDNTGNLTAPGNLISSDALVINTSGQNALFLNQFGIRANTQLELSAENFATGNNSTIQFDKNGGGITLKLETDAPSQALWSFYPGNVTFPDGSNQNTAYGNAKVAELLANFGNNSISTTGNITSGNVDAGNLRTAGSVSLTGNLTVGASMSVLRGDATLPDVISQSKTTGTITIGGTATTGTVTLNPSMANSQTNIATGVFGAGITKGINIGTGGTANSQTNFLVGPFTGTGNFFVQQGTTVTIASPSANALSVTGTVTGANFVVPGQTNFNSLNTVGDQIGVNKTSGTLDIGSLSQTGTVTVGRSTANSILNIGTGATSNANIKNINIGTGGVVGSNTNILIGPIGGGSGGVGLVQTQGNTTVRITNTGADALSVAGTVTGANIVLPPVPFANLTATPGGRAIINNANLVAAGNFGANVSGGGSNVVPVWSDGTNWYIG